MKVIIGILFIILISIIAFCGVFKKEKGIWKNLIPDYQFGMDIEGSRELKYALDEEEEEKYVYVDENGKVMGEVWKDGTAQTEEDETSSEEEGQTEAEEEMENTETAEETEEVPYAKETRTIKANPDEKLTKENFEQSKQIIQKRLKEQNISEANIRIDDVTGALVIETTNDNENVELVEGLVEQVGKFQIIDYQNGLVLMDNEDIKKVSVVASSSSGYSTYLQIEFNKEGSKKLQEISTKYVEITNETEATTDEEEEEHDHEEETTKKYVSVVLDGTTMMTTYFGEEMSGGILQIAVGQTRTEYEESIEDYESAEAVATILNSGVLPTKFELETDNFVKSEITTQKMQQVIIACAIVIAIISVIFIIRFKKNGLLADILGIGYLAIFSLVIRYTNVRLTLNAVITCGILGIMNYIFLNQYLKKTKIMDMAKAYQEAMQRFYLVTIPISVIAVVFTLATQTAINSIGMVLFWGMLLMAIYNLTITRVVLKK